MMGRRDDIAIVHEVFKPLVVSAVRGENFRERLCPLISISFSVTMEVGRPDFTSIRVAMRGTAVIKPHKNHDPSRPRFRQVPLERSTRDLRKSRINFSRPLEETSGISLGGNRRRDHIEPSLPPFSIFISLSASACESQSSVTGRSSTPNASVSKPLLKVDISDPLFENLISFVSMSLQRICPPKKEGFFGLSSNKNVFFFRKGLIHVSFLVMFFYRRDEETRIIPPR